METVVTSALGDKKLGVYWATGDGEFRAQKFGKIDKVETFSSETNAKGFITGQKSLSLRPIGRVGKSKKAPRGSYQKFIVEKVRLYENKLTGNELVILAEQAPEFEGVDPKSIKASILFYYNRR